MRNKKGYMNGNSITRLPMFGNVDTDNEICLNAIAIAYDALNMGVFKSSSIAEINGRFGVLRMLCSRHAPNMHVVVDKLHHIVVENCKGNISDVKALSMIRDICFKHNINSDIFDYAIMRIRQKESVKQNMNVKKVHNPFEFDTMLFIHKPVKKK